MLTYLGASDSLQDKNILWSEPLLMPNALRQPLTELFFEGYGLNSVAFFNDSLAALHQSTHKTNLLGGNGNILSLGHSSCTLIPLVQDQPLRQGFKRLPFGGQKLTEFLLKSMQLKYPSFPLKMTQRESAHVLKNYTMVAERYVQQLATLEDPLELAKWDIVLQYPYPKDLSESSDSIVTANQAALAEEKCAAFKEKMKQVAERKKMERLAEIESQLQGLLQMKAKKNEDLEEDEEYLELLQSFGYEDERDFEAFIADLNMKRNKILGIAEEPSTVKASISDWSLLSVADEELDEDQIKEKRKLRLLKAGMDARERQKKQKEEQAEKEKKLALLDDQKRQQDFKAWLQEKNEKRKYLLEQIDMLEKSKSRKSTLAQSRLRNLSFLAETQEGDVDSDEEASVSTKKKRKSMGNAAAGKAGYGDEAEDWDRYRQLDPLELQETLETQLNSLEETLMKYDPSFNAQEHPAAQEPGFQVYETFMFGAKPFDESVASSFQLHFNVERFRVPEILFSPSIIGLECSGLSDLLQSSHDAFPEASHAAFLCGGLSQIQGLKQRISSDICQSSLAGHTFSVEASQDPLLAPWKGAASWANTNAKTDPTLWMHSKDYSEHGFDRIIKQLKNNIFIA